MDKPDDKSKIPVRFPAEQSVRFRHAPPDAAPKEAMRSRLGQPSVFRPGGLGHRFVLPTLPVDPVKPRQHASDNFFTSAKRMADFAVEEIEYVLDGILPPGTLDP